MPLLSPVRADGAPPALGPYSHAIVTQGGWVFASGQIPLDPESGELVRGSARDQTARVLRNAAAVLKGAGASLDTVVKTTVFLSDMKLFPEMNQAYEAAFGGHRPARSTVAVAGLPMGVDVEIEMVARVAEK